MATSEEESATWSQFDRSVSLFTESQTEYSYFSEKKTVRRTKS
jgi:hypothetical protein